MNIYIRIAGINGFMPNNFFTKAYDCRLLYILSGSGRITIEGNEFPLKKNTLCYYPSGTKYFPEANEGDPLFFVTINFDLTRDFENVTWCLPPVKAENFIPRFAQNSHSDCDVEMFKEPFVMQDANVYRENIIKVAEEKMKGNERAASGLLQYVCYKIAESRHKPQGLYGEIVDYINLNYAAIISNKDIAEALNYHPYYINKVFRKASGKTIHKYLREVRLNKSAELLSETDYSVRDIALSVGFVNPDHFTKCFSEEFGMSPTAFRKQNSHLNYI